MIPQRSAEQALALADQGWNVSAIARHLGHDRKTIRIYLNGRRMPGQPRPQADSFAPFADYAARRLHDDPHLRASGLHHELTGLGYTGSYSALTRELRNSGINTTCPACQHKPDTYLRAPIRHPRQNLPIRVAPIAGETIASYLERLATANHLPAGLLLAHLPPWFTARDDTHDDLTGAARATPAEVEDLANLSGLDTTALLHALPAFGSGSPHHGRPPVRATHACRGCAARHGHTEPVPVHLPAHQRLCPRHRIWLGLTTQIELTATPEIIHAHRRACHLAHRYSPARLMLAEVTAHHQITATRRHGNNPDIVKRRITTLAPANRRLTQDHPDLIEAATYPETISNAANALRSSTKTMTGPE